MNLGLSIGERRSCMDDNLTETNNIDVLRTINQDTRAGIIEIDEC